MAQITMQFWADFACTRCSCIVDLTAGFMSFLADTGMSGAFCADAQL